MYIWPNDERRRFTLLGEFFDFKFDKRIIYDTDDYRLEYRGDLRDKNIPHGLGTLTLKDGKTMYTGDWIDGKRKESTIVLRGAK